VSTETTRVGLLSDIHGNAVALEAVLEDIGSVDAIVCAGDTVGYGPSPGQCVKMVRDRELPTVRGNHDRAVVRGQPYESGDQYASRNLSNEALE
jgi:predicted phosphodiesterase